MQLKEISRDAYIYMHMLYLREKSHHRMHDSCSLLNWCVSVFNNVNVILLPVLLQLLRQPTERWSLLRQQTPTRGHQKFISKQKSNHKN